MNVSSFLETTTYRGGRRRCFYPGEEVPGRLEDLASGRQRNYLSLLLRGEGVRPVRGLHESIEVCPTRASGSATCRVVGNLEWAPQCLHRLAHGFYM